MCPACVATAAIVAVGTTSAGGVTAFAVRKALNSKRPEGEQPPSRHTQPSGDKNAK